MRRFNTQEEMKISKLITVDDSQVEYKVNRDAYLAYFAGSLLATAETIEDLAACVNEFLEEE